MFSKICLNLLNLCHAHRRRYPMSTTCWNNKFPLNIFPKYFYHSCPVKTSTKPLGVSTTNAHEEGRSSTSSFWGVHVETNAILHQKMHSCKQVLAKILHTEPNHLHTKCLIPFRISTPMIATNCFQRSERIFNSRFGLKF